MMSRKFSALAVALPLALAGCGPDGPTKQETGTVVGALAGGLLGHTVGNGSGKVVATMAGAFIGGVVGSEIGKSMDQQDRMLAQQAEMRALESGSSGQPVAWRNPDNGRRGEVIPGPAFKRGYQDCREYTHRVYIDGREQAMRGTACRNPDGTWTAVT